MCTRALGRFATAYTVVMSRGCAAAHSRGDRLGELPDLVLRRPAYDRHVHVQTARAGGLHVARHADRGECFVENEGGLAHGLEGHVGTRVEVEVQVVGSIGIVGTRVPLVQIDAPEVDDPQQRRQVLDHRELDHLARAVRDPAGGEPWRPRCRRLLHEEERAFGAVRIALHDHGAIADVRQQHRRDAQVVADEVALGEAERGPERLGQVGEGGLAVAEGDDGAIEVPRDDVRRVRASRLTAARSTRRRGRGARAGRHQRCRRVRRRKIPKCRTASRSRPTPS